MLCCIDQEKEKRKLIYFEVRMSILMYFVSNMSKKVDFKNPKGCEAHEDTMNTNICMMAERHTKYQFIFSLALDREYS